MRLAMTILQRARAREIQNSALETAKLCKPPAAAELHRRRSRCLQLLLARERKRSRKLVELISG